MHRSGRPGVAVPYHLPGCHPGPRSLLPASLGREEGGKWEAIARKVGYNYPESGRHDLHLAKSEESTQNPIAPPGVEAREASVFLPPLSSQTTKSLTLTRLLRPLRRHLLVIPKKISNRRQRIRLATAARLEPTNGKQIAQWLHPSLAPRGRDSGRQKACWPA